ncbi:MAG: hypothetical protein A4E32_01339 [Methanomassiliicoccales archaeon PtaU1.Bin124]|nr:MAG: hypothetical protein A4E32_01339 [Methanomassiliicoccales archaeon PtaU1.Bin124]
MQTMGVRHIPVTTSERDDRIDTALAMWWVATVDAFVRTVGQEKALIALTPVFRQIGRQDALKVAMDKKIIGHDAIALATYVNFWEEMMGIQGKIVESTPDRVVKENYSCPLARGPPEACKLLELSINGSAEEMSPDFSFMGTHAMTKGDHICRWVIERRR